MKLNVSILVFSEVRSRSRDLQQAAHRPAHLPIGHAWLSALLLVLSLTFSTTTQAQESIEFVVPFGPGGTTDRVARVFSSIAVEMTGEQFIVSNQPGGGGNVALLGMLDRAPDTAAGVFPIATGAGGRFLEMGFKVVGSVGQEQFALYAANGSPFLDGNPFDGIAENGASVAYLAGSRAARLIARDLEKNLGAALTLVPLDQAVQITESVGSGAVDFAVGPLSSFGRVADLLPAAVLGRDRVPAIPNIPTALELGLDVQGTIDYVLFAPTEISDEAFASLAETSAAVANSEAFGEALIGRGISVASFRPADSFLGQIESASNDYCETCDCEDDDDCQDECPKCDSN